MGRLMKRLESRQARVSLLVFLFVMITLGPLVHPYKAQQASRYALTAAIVDNQTVKLDGYEEVVRRPVGARENEAGRKPAQRPIVCVHQSAQNADENSVLRQRRFLRVGQTPPLGGVGYVALECLEHFFGGDVVMHDTPFPRFPTPQIW